MPAMPAGMACGLWAALARHGEEEASRLAAMPPCGWELSTFRHACEHGDFWRAWGMRRVEVGGHQAGNMCMGWAAGAEEQFPACSASYSVSGRIPARRKAPIHMPCLPAWRRQGRERHGQTGSWRAGGAGVVSLSLFSILWTGAG